MYRMMFQGLFFSLLMRLDMQQVQQSVAQWVELCVRRWWVQFLSFCRHLILGRKTLPQSDLEEEDEDVATENLRVASGAASSDILQINQLTKIYQHFSKKVPVVKKLSVGIPAGEVRTRKQKHKLVIQWSLIKDCVTVKWSFFP